MNKINMATGGGGQQRPPDEKTSSVPVKTQTPKKTK